MAKSSLPPSSFLSNPTFSSWSWADNFRIVDIEINALSPLYINLKPNFILH